MEKRIKIKESTKCYIDCGNQTSAGTAITKMLKAYIDEKYDRTIVEESDIKHILEDVEEKAMRIGKENPRLKMPSIGLKSDSGYMSGEGATMWWLRFEGDIEGAHIVKLNGEVELNYEEV